MTSELRPEVEVASAVYDECRERGIRDGGALIKADREAVRAEQAAEIERLKSHLEDAKEIIQKQIKQAAELAKFKALAETLAEAVKVFMPTNINLRMPHPDDSFIVPLDVSMGELRALDAALRQYKEARDV